MTKCKCNDSRFASFKLKSDDTRVKNHMNSLYSDCNHMQRAKQSTRCNRPLGAVKSYGLERIKRL